MLSQRALKLSSLHFSVLLQSSDSRSRVHPAASFAPVIPSAAFFMAVIVQFCLLFKSPSSPLAVSCIFLVCASILLGRSWITTLNPRRWVACLHMIQSFWGFILFYRLSRVPLPSHLRSPFCSLQDSSQGHSQLCSSLWVLGSGTPFLICNAG